MVFRADADHSAGDRDGRRRPARGYAGVPSCTRDRSRPRRRAGVRRPVRVRRTRRLSSDPVAGGRVSLGRDRRRGRRQRCRRPRSRSGRGRIRPWRTTLVHRPTKVVDQRPVGASVPCRSALRSQRAAALSPEQPQRTTALPRPLSRQPPAPAGRYSPSTSGPPRSFPALPTPHPRLQPRNAEKGPTRMRGAQSRQSKIVRR